MCEHERRTIDDLLAIYQFERTIKHVFVEGRYDRVLIDWFITESTQRGMPVRDCYVYEIGDIDVPNTVVIAHGLSEGERARVIALALELEGNLAAGSTRATCVADRDFADLLHEVFAANCLLLTDYACMEMYLYTEIVFDRFVRLYCPECEISAGELLRQVADVGQQLFQLRLVNQLEEFGLNFKEFTLKKFLALRDETISFDRDEYLVRLLHKHNLADFREKFDVGIVEFEARARRDPRHQMNGHDATQICAWYIAQMFNQKQKAIGDPEVVARSLRTCFDYENLAAENLFRVLLERVRD